jgi:hypothetical protein
MMGGKVFFALTARAELSPDVQAPVRKYGLGKLVVYDGEARKKYQQASIGRFEKGASAAGVGRSLWKSARGLASTAMTALSLRVTIDSLMNGEHMAHDRR